MQKGLGSSAASIIAGLLLGNALCNNQLIENEILQIELILYLTKLILIYN